MPSIVKTNQEGINPNSITSFNVVFDLDECLIHTMINAPESLYRQIMEEEIELRSRLYRFDLVDVGRKKGQGVTQSYWGVTRPDLEQFLDFCYTYFRSISVWSAAQPSYVRAVVSRIFRGRKPPFAIFTSDHIESDPVHSYHKPLAKMVDQFPTVLSLEKTLFLDDRDANFITCRGNGVTIPAYRPNPTIESIKQHDDCFHSFAFFLLDLHKKGVTDVRKVDKSQIFNSKYLIPSR